MDILTFLLGAISVIVGSIAKPMLDKLYQRVKAKLTRKSHTSLKSVNTRLTTLENKQLTKREVRDEVVRYIKTLQK